MTNKPLCEITVTTTDHQEWQGSVYLPSSGKRQSFHSLLELIKAVDQHTGASDLPSWQPDKKTGTDQR